MAGLGIDAYRFSIAWPRVQPGGQRPGQRAGPGLLRPAGRRAAGRRGITPVPTLFHWDLPQPLEDEGGWLARDTAYRFADYAAARRRAARRPDPALDHAERAVRGHGLGYALGTHAPGQALMLGALPAAHHQLLGHGLATAALRVGRRTAGRDHQQLRPGVARQRQPGRPGRGRRLRHPAEPALHRPGAARGLSGPVRLRARRDPDFVRDGDLELISAPIDALGVNYYAPARLAAPPDAPLPFQREPIPGYPVTAFGWPVVPAALRDLLLRLRERYGPALPPVYITENGCSTDDAVTADGTVDDQPRIRYLDGHLRALHDGHHRRRRRARLPDLVADGQLRVGRGLHQRFGLVHVNFETQQRTPKASFGWYRDSDRRPAQAAPATLTGWLPAAPAAAAVSCPLRRQPAPPARCGRGRRCGALPTFRR